jgi:CRP/FNR family transcriptional regulator, nitrogen fixation regulation protein
MDISSSATGELLEGILQEGTHGRLGRLATTARYAIGESVYRHNDPAEHWFRVLAGAARKSTLSGDGYRHIVDFLLPGDFFGFCASAGHDFCVEAIVPGTVIARYARGSSERLADCDPQVAKLIRELAFASIARLQRRVIILGRSSALEKVSSFLLEMADRGQPGATQPVYLPMSRYDIADYLAMAAETLCRTLTALRARRAISFRDARWVRICDRAALERVSDRLSRQSGHRREATRCIPPPCGAACQRVP